MLACATLAAISWRAPCLSAAGAGVQEISVTLRGEELTALTPPPIRPDRPFDLPIWSTESALEELFRAPLAGGAVDPLGLSPAPQAVPSPTTRPRERAAAAIGGLSQTSRPEEVLPDRETEAGPLPAESPVAAIAASRPSAAGVAEASPEPARGAMLPSSPARGSAGLSQLEPGSEAWSLGEVLPASHSSAELGISYRIGQRIDLAGLLAIVLPLSAAGLDIRLLVPDTVVPTAFVSSAGLLARLRGSVGARSIVASLDISGLLRRSPDGTTGQALAAAADVDWTPGPVSFSVGAEVARLSEPSTGAGATALHPSLGIGLHVAPAVTLLAGADATIAMAGAVAVRGYLLAGVQLSPPALPLLLRAGVAGTADGSSFGVLPLVAIEASSPGVVTFGAEVGPFAHTPESLPLLMLPMAPPSRPLEPERGFAARAYLEVAPGIVTSLRLDAAYADGLLWTVAPGALDVVQARRLSALLTWAVSLASGGELRFSVAPSACWVAGATAGLSELTARAEARLGFWRAGLAGILRPAQPGRPSSVDPMGTGAWLTEALDAAPGLQLVASLARSFASGGSVNAEARIFAGQAAEGVRAAIQLGGSIGVR